MSVLNKNITNPVVLKRVELPLKISGVCNLTQVSTAWLKCALSGCGGFWEDAALRGE